jgi:CRP-like cAMP-binding protein
MNSTSLRNGVANELYAALPAELRMELAKYEHSMTVPGGTQLIKHGVSPDHLVIVNSGSVEITLGSIRESVSLACAEAGKVFGMHAVVSGNPPEADVTSRENCQVTLIPREEFLKAARNHPQMYFAIAKVLSNDLVMAQRFLKTFLRRPARRKPVAKSLHI